MLQRVSTWTPCSETLPDADRHSDWLVLAPTMTSSAAHNVLSHWIAAYPREGPERELLGETRTRTAGKLREENLSLPRMRVPHISPSFGEMWIFTHAGARVPVEPEKFRFESS